MNYIDMRAEAKILAAGFEKGMAALGESIERGLKAMAEAMVQPEQQVRVREQEAEERTLREQRCLLSYTHPSHEWTLSRGPVSEEVYCPGVR